MVNENHYLVDLSEVLCPLIHDAPLSSLTEPEQVFVCVYDLERDVNNGGFEQYFFNSAGGYANDAIRALERIGASSAARITREAVAVAFPSGVVPSDQDARWEALDDDDESTEEALSALDHEFYDYPDDLTHLLFLYVQDNLGSIRGARRA